MQLFWQKESEKELSDKIRKAEEALLTGQRNVLRFLYSAVIEADRENAKLAAGCIGEELKKLNAAQMMNLEREFRTYTSMEWFTDFEKVCLENLKEKLSDEELFLWVVRLGTFHPNGYFREKCIQELKSDLSSAPYLILRCNDWVAVIRNQLSNSLIQNFKKMNGEELLALLPFLAKVRQGERYEKDMFCGIEEEYFLCLREKIQQLGMYELRQLESRGTCYLYSMLLEKQMLSKTQIKQLISLERTSVGKRLLFSGLWRQYEISMDEAEVFLQDKSSVVRKMAMEFKYNMIGDAWQGLEFFLLDHSKSVRDWAAYILRKHTDMDVLEFYKAHLREPDTLTAILGMGQQGSKEALPLIEPFLNSEDERYVRNAIKSMGRLLAEDGADLYWRYLFDERVQVSKAAYRAICDNRICMGAETIYQALLNCENFNKRKYLINLLLQESSWSRLPFLLLLYQYEEKDLRDRIQKAANARSYYARLTKEAAERIKEIMYREELQIPKRVQEEIALDLKYVTA